MKGDKMVFDNYLSALLPEKEDKAREDFHRLSQSILQQQSAVSLKSCKTAGFDERLSELRAEIDKN
jgi:hypothetical protein